MNRSQSEVRIDPLQLSNVYNKTINYLRGSHDKPQTLDAMEIFDEGDSDGALELEDMMFVEIDKYNKLKQQK